MWFCDSSNIFKGSKHISAGQKDIKYPIHIFETSKKPFWGPKRHFSDPRIPEEILLIQKTHSRGPKYTLVVYKYTSVVQKDIREVEKISRRSKHIFEVHKDISVAQKHRYLGHLKIFEAVKNFRTCDNDLYLDENFSGNSFRNF